MSTCKDRLTCLPFSNVLVPGGTGYIFYVHICAIYMFGIFSVSNITHYPGHLRHSPVESLHDVLYALVGTYWVQLQLKKMFFIIVIRFNILILMCVVNLSGNPSYTPLQVDFDYNYLVVRMCTLHVVCSIGCDNIPDWRDSIRWGYVSVPKLN